MALTGLLLMGFLVAHLAGNLSFWADAEGVAFDAYAAKLESTGPLLLAAEIGLALLFLAHIAMAFRLSVDNREKRSVRNAQRATKGRSQVASGTMMISGAIVLVFLLIHIWDFRLQNDAEEGLAALVRARLSSPAGALIYLVGVGALTLHLSHAFSSALRTLGVSHPKYDKLFERIGLGLAAALGLGYLSFPVVLFLTGGGSH